MVFNRALLYVHAVNKLKTFHICQSRTAKKPVITKTWISGENLYGGEQRSNQHVALQKPTCSEDVLRK